MLPDWLLWLLPVPLVTGTAAAWAWWSTRTRGPQDPARTVRQYERFRAALATPPPSRAERHEAPGSR